MPDQHQRERAAPQDAPWAPKTDSPFNGPRSPDIQKPDTSKLLKRMNSIDKNQSRKYRQRSGQ